MCTPPCSSTRPGSWRCSTGATSLGAAEGDAAAGLAPLAGRTVGPAEDLERVRLRMVAQGIRRLAVVDDGGALLGLLCLKRSGSGFCSDDDVAARAAERRGPGVC